MDPDQEGHGVNPARGREQPGTSSLTDPLLEAMALQGIRSATKQQSQVTIGQKVQSKTPKPRIPQTKGKGNQTKGGLGREQGFPEMQGQGKSSSQSKGKSKSKDKGSVNWEQVPA